MEKLEVYLPNRLAHRLQSESTKTGSSVGKILATTLRQRYTPRRLDPRTRKRMIEGYKEWADENRRLANEWTDLLVESEP